MVTTVRRARPADDQAISDIMCAGYRFIAGPDGITGEQVGRLLGERCTVQDAAAIRARWDCLVAEMGPPLARLEQDSRR